MLFRIRLAHARVPLIDGTLERLTLEYDIAFVGR